MVAKTTPITDAVSGDRLRSNAEKTGTDTTDKPVMKPHFEAVVYSRPIV